MTDIEKTHTRRIRYKGTHPRKFSEKYKELNPTKYPEIIQKIKSRGQTPVGTHIPICVNEINEVLQLKKGMIGIDCTLGYGGHAKNILKKILPEGKLIGLDIDSVELKKAKHRIRNIGVKDSSFIARNLNFKNIKETLKLFPTGFDFVLADLGVSSMQLDTPTRGFSYKNQAPLDLRMNPLTGDTAAHLLMEIKEYQLANILFENSDEPNAELIAKSIIANRNDCRTTTGLASVIKEALNSIGINNNKISIQRVFQALRIEVNKEFTALDELLSSAPEVLKSGGRIAILSFHSGEDRRVKKNFKKLVEIGVYSECLRRPIRASFQEQYDNPRSSSAKLRWAKKK